MSQIVNSSISNPLAHAEAHRLYCFLSAVIVMKVRPITVASRVGLCCLLISLVIQMSCSHSTDPRAAANRALASPHLLSPSEAAELAAKLANDKCENQFHERPFHAVQHVPVIKDRQYHWGDLDVGAPKGLSASVTFDLDGSKPSVDIYFSTDTLHR